MQSHSTTTSTSSTEPTLEQIASVLGEIDWLFRRMVLSMHEEQLEKADDPHTNMVLRLINNTIKAINEGWLSLPTFLIRERGTLARYHYFAKFNLWAIARLSVETDGLKKETITTSYCNAIFTYRTNYKNLLLGYFTRELHQLTKTSTRKTHDLLLEKMIATHKASTRELLLQDEFYKIEKVLLHNIPRSSWILLQAMKSHPRTQIDSEFWQNTLPDLYYGVDLLDHTKEGKYDFRSLYPVISNHLAEINKHCVSLMNTVQKHRSVQPFEASSTPTLNTYEEKENISPTLISSRYYPAFKRKEPDPDKVIETNTSENTTTDRRLKEKLGDTSTPEPTKENTDQSSIPLLTI